MKDQIVIDFKKFDFNIFKKFNFNIFKWIKNLFTPKIRFDIESCETNFMYDIFGREISRDKFYVIYKKAPFSEKKYLDFWEYDLRDSNKGDIKVTYYHSARNGYKFKTREEAEKVLNMIYSTPERFRER